MTSWTIYFHDIGKLEGGRDEGHGRLSLELGGYHVKMMDSDTASIPGRSGRTMRARPDYQPNVIDVRPRLIEVFRRLNG